MRSTEFFEFFEFSTNSPSKAGKTRTEKIVATIFVNLGMFILLCIMMGKLSEVLQSTTMAIAVTFVVGVTIWSLALKFLKDNNLFSEKADSAVGAFVALYALALIWTRVDTPYRELFSIPMVILILLEVRDIFGQESKPMLTPTQAVEDSKFFRKIR